MTARRLTQARFTREQARFISKTPGLDPAIKAAIRQAAVSGSTVTLRARQHEDLIRAVGRQAVALAAEAAGLSVTVVDVSPWAVDNVKNKVDVAFVADVERLDWVGRYDIVLCSGVLDYVSRPAVAVRNLCRLVSPAGRLVVLVPRVGVGGSVHALIVRRASGLRVNLFTATWLAREAKRWGLELIQARRPLPHNLVALFQRATVPAIAAIL
jgi:2-polyprenyl-3-methyl-5-hydroxy-6-metoxy-1,4-benzoquinol methylase